MRRSRACRRASRGLASSRSAQTLATARALAAKARWTLAKVRLWWVRSTVVISSSTHTVASTIAKSMAGSWPIVA